MREKATNCLKKLISYIDPKKNEEMLFNLVKRLNDNGYFMAKSAAVSLIPAILPNLS